MISVRRVAIIYRKELVEILRDRRTLIAMIVIPVVLYPVLMLWLLWEAEAEQAHLRKQTYVIQVSDDPSRQALEHIVETARPQPSTSPATEAQPAFVVRTGTVPDDQLGDDVQLRVALQEVHQPPPLPTRIEIQIDFTEVDIRSRTAKEELIQLLNEYRMLVTRDSIRRILGNQGGIQPASALARRMDTDIDLILNPVEVTATSTASQRQRGGWALGQIIPILLVIMIVSGAIYPAVDLTAGERERGTLETLMVTPVPTVHLIVGKFLVVATIALLTATLNLASVGATMHFGGISKVMSAQMPVEFPLAVLPLILLCMVPLSLLCAALLVAVCSFARTFKEAQNYVVPVIIGTLVACVPVSMQTARLEGGTIILPVGNMVLLARDMLQQNCSWPAAVGVLLSTSLYAAAAIAVAARLFGQEAVLFVDTGSFKNMFRRRLFKPVSLPTAAQTFLLAALIFPVCFYGQAGLSAESAQEFARVLKGLAIWQFAGLFVVVPVAFCVYFKIGVRETLRLRMPPARAWLAALLLGSSSWILAQEFVVWQHRLLPPSEAMAKASQQIENYVNGIPLPLVVLLLAVVPGICEEVFFRGFLFSGFTTAMKKWPAIFASAGVFATFHFMVDRIPLTFLLGALLAYICWQTRSLLPGILFHLMHNGSTLVLPHIPSLLRILDLEDTASESAHMPGRLLIVAIGLFALGFALVATLSSRAKTSGGQSLD